MKSQPLSSKIAEELAEIIFEGKNINPERSCRQSVSFQRCWAQAAPPSEKLQSSSRRADTDRKARRRHFVSKNPVSQGIRWDRYTDR